ncbi:cupin domain-containing protein [Pantoea sp. Lu_F5_004]|uniref:cupin domain-containing protein n=1 Tax=Pantoea sp. Lu_F5_004 TaxID=3443507 RepID=UPI003EBB0E7E
MNKLIAQSVCRSRLADMTRGWFVGAFSPAAYQTSDVEVAVQSFPAGYRGEAHYHRIATEVTLLLSGEARMAGEPLVAGDILTLMPGTSTAFEALTDCVTVVVKHPGTLDDKYPDEDTQC